MKNIILYNALLFLTVKKFVFVLTKFGNAGLHKGASRSFQIWSTQTQILGL
jgi:hypothetical protein